MVHSGLQTPEIAVKVNGKEAFAQPQPAFGFAPNTLSTGRFKDAAGEALARAFTLPRLWGEPSLRLINPKHSKQVEAFEMFVNPETGIIQRASGAGKKYDLVRPMLPYPGVSDLRAIAGTTDAFDEFLSNPTAGMDDRSRFQPILVLEQAWERCGQERNILMPVINVLMRMTGDHLQYDGWQYIFRMAQARQVLVSKPGDRISAPAGITTAEFDEVVMDYNYNRPEILGKCEQAPQFLWHAGLLCDGDQELKVEDRKLFKRLHNLMTAAEFRFRN